jgi:hypothetical protein
MENDHLHDAILFLKSCLENMSKGYKANMRSIERAIEEIELEIAQRPASAHVQDKSHD